MTAILPADPAQAVQALTEITEQLLDVMQTESGHIARFDEPAMQAAEKSKEELAGRYQKAAQEFSARVEEFRGVDRALLDRLEAAQNALGLVTRDNQHFLRA